MQNRLFADNVLPFDTTAIKIFAEHKSKQRVFL